MEHARKCSLSIATLPPLPQRFCLIINYDILKFYIFDIFNSIKNYLFQPLWNFLYSPFHNSLPLCCKQENGRNFMKRTEFFLNMTLNFPNLEEDEDVTCNVCDRSFPLPKDLRKHKIKKRHWGWVLLLGRRQKIIGGGGQFERISLISSLLFLFSLAKQTWIEINVFFGEMRTEFYFEWFFIWSKKDSSTQDFLQYKLYAYLLPIVKPIKPFLKRKDNIEYK